MHGNVKGSSMVEVSGASSVTSFKKEGGHTEMICICKGDVATGLKVTQ